MPVDVGATLQRLRAVLTRPLPEGGRLPDDVWSRRHRGLTLLLAVQAAALVVTAELAGSAITWQHLASEGTTGAAIVFWIVVASATTIALIERLRRAVRTGAVAIGLIACSAYLVHITGGLSEVHLHVFVMLAVVSLYQDWLPFLAASGAIALHHLVLGTVVPQRLFADPASADAPGRTVVLYLLFLGAANVASILAWRLGERDRARADLVLDATADGVHGVDPQGRITFANAALAKLVGERPERLVGRDHHEALGHVAPEGQPCPVCTTVRAGRGVPTGGLALRRRDGRDVPVECGATVLWDKGVVTGIVATFRDLTERERLQRQALHDELTGLANRTLLRAHLAQALARIDRDRHTAALLFCDLDQFKDVNDTLGHATGDELLRQAADRLRAAVRAHDTVSRMGGDEFVVLCTDLESRADVMVIAERLQQALSEPYEVEGLIANVSVSVGLTVFDDPRANADALLEEADTAMYRAKELGRDRVEIFDESLRAQTERRQQLETEFADAIAESAVEVRYQPRVELTGGRLDAVAAIPVWPHPERGELPAEELLGLAEETALVDTLGRYVLATACRQVASWREHHGQRADLALAVRITRPQLRDGGLADAVAQVLAESGLPPDRLCLEISEHALLDDTPATVDGLRALKRLGVMLAVDDFGAGWSSLAYLTRVPIDVLKVDRSFIATLDQPGDSHAIVAATLGLSRSLGLEVVADGVDRPGQAAALRELGCQLVQGDHFATAADSRTVEERIAAAVARPPRDPSHRAPTASEPPGSPTP
ncbi:GGDEF and EAL domain-containing protein [Egibacter rhizosphaerae]|uniref:GGDEF and EAL domain-containing protein n=1 Tax=Egibacter rhizosphaerae TaxID=1670831 RepID=A0A411YHH0_9ACTN|nr:EAL domain-containing protein [Egibacter rhizosphaerae]QBI20673.1 GGDEF and EAL domain-containing protein [Egibacter rhizosphaerae]